MSRISTPIQQISSASSVSEVLALTEIRQISSPPASEKYPVVSASLSASLSASPTAQKQTPAILSPMAAVALPKTAESEFKRRLRMQGEGLVSPLDTTAHPVAAGIGILSPPGFSTVVGNTPSPPPLDSTPPPQSRSVSPIRIRGPVLEDVSYGQSPPVPHTTAAGASGVAYKYPRSVPCPPPPGMTEVFVVEWSPHPDPQVLEIQRGGAGVQPCAVLHLHGVRNTVIPAESIIDVAVAGSMWMHVNCKNGESFKVRPRSSPDYGPLAEALGALFSVGEAATGLPLRSVKPGKKGLQRAPSPWAPFFTNLFYIFRLILVLVLVVVCCYYVGDTIQQWGASPLLAVHHLPSPIIANLTLPCARLRESGSDCQLFLIDCGNDYTCTYNATEVSRQIQTSNVTTIFGLFGPSAQGSRNDPFLSKLGSVLTLSEHDGSLSDNSLNTLSSHIVERCPNHFRFG
eukprot:TRINITY_DN14672_c2_g1_i1.p1 TRINITY_DN14672_c2_g1~~TRINITY_DN14672_c2_g1_i1.p1  ORF type:complete len:475 (+),score=40.29 TRINITY_DN14672_c2_g1_i1:52-1425(+)